MMFCLDVGDGDAEKISLILPKNHLLEIDSDRNVMISIALGASGKPIITLFA